MLEWAKRVGQVIAKPPGNDEGLSSEQIARAGNLDLSGASNWTIICEEMLDTQIPTTYFDAARRELHRRGFTDEEILEMRRFAWMTAGWLNFEKMVWDWASLDESDILLAIKWQHADGIIDKAERDRRLECLNRYR